jgi:hypothetical protein
LLLPFLVVALIELALRIGGYGYPTDFFKVDRDASGKAWLVNNDQFTLRFFPPELARWPSPFRISEEKPANIQRIFILGESAAMGDPEPSVGASHYLEILLRERFPGQAFEIVNLGITAINSHVIFPIARDVAARGRGDIWLIYMGNNEMVGPFGAATVFGARAWPLSAARLNLAIQKTRVGQLALQCLRALGGKSKNAGWRGMKMFLENQVPPDDPRRETVYRNFKSNLQDILHAGRKSGASIVLSTVSVNLRDCPPFASLANTNLAATDRSQFDSLYTGAVALETNHVWSEAAQKFQEAARFDPKFAELQFRWGQCLLSESNVPVARERFQAACDVDALPFRTDTRINRIIRDAATRSPGSQFAFCDTESGLAAASSCGIAGDESFFEHVHFNFDGNYRLARAWAESIAQLLPPQVRQKAADAWASQDVCEQGLGLSDWNRMFVYTTVVGRMAQPPLATQLNNAARVEA